MLMNLLSFSQAVEFTGILVAFIGTFFMTKVCMDILPTDLGREFAVDGAKSKGKPRGAGIIFVLVFAVCTLLFASFSIEKMVYVILVVLAMLTGFLDDASRAPWGEYKKGLLDLLIAIMIAVTFLYYNDNVVHFALFDYDVTLPVWLYGVLIVILVWASINVTNCTDGVDGLSATLSVITLGSIVLLDYFMSNLFATMDYVSTILMFIAGLIAYLWYNATPSKLLMGDAGSRAMGLFIAIAILKSHCPVFYLLVAAVMIVDGGLGLIKVSLLRFLKIHILKNTRTPIHDHVRKNKDWSNTHVVFRFAIIQILISFVALGYVAVMYF